MFTVTELHNFAVYSPRHILPIKQECLGFGTSLWEGTRTAEMGSIMRMH